MRSLFQTYFDKQSSFWFKVHFRYGRPKILLVNLWQPMKARNLSVRRHERPSGRFLKSRGLSASVSFLPFPPPPPSFTRSIFRVVILCSRTPQKRLLRRLLIRLVPVLSFLLSLTIDYSSVTFLTVHSGESALWMLINTDQRLFYRPD